MSVTGRPKASSSGRRPSSRNPTPSTPCRERTNPRVNRSTSRQYAEPSRCAPCTEPSTTGRTSRTRCSDSTAPRAVWRWVDSHSRRPLLVIPSSLLARRSPASTSTPTSGGTRAEEARLELKAHPTSWIADHDGGCRRPKRSTVSRHARLTAAKAPASSPGARRGFGRRGPIISTVTSRSPLLSRRGRMVTVDGLGGAHWVLIQYARLCLPGDLGGGARSRDHDRDLFGELLDLPRVVQEVV